MQLLIHLDKLPLIQLQTPIDWYAIVITSLFIILSTILGCLFTFHYSKRLLKRTIQAKIADYRSAWSRQMRKHFGLLSKDLWLFFELSQNESPDYGTPYNNQLIIAKEQVNKRVLEYYFALVALIDKRYQCSNHFLYELHFCWDVIINKRLSEQLMHHKYRKIREPFHAILSHEWQKTKQLLMSQ